QVPRLRLIDAAFLDVFHQSELHRVITVRGGRLALRHHARTRLEQRHRHGLAVRPEHLRHSDLFAKDSWTHLLNPFLTRIRCGAEKSKSGICVLCVSASPRQAFHFPNALISTSTPAGRSSFISASTVCWVGSRMSNNRLCVRISNCSRDFLSTCGDRSTVVMLRLVGNGIGPATSPPVLFPVSMLSLSDSPPTP